MSCVVVRCSALLQTSSLLDFQILISQHRRARFPQVFQTVDVFLFAACNLQVVTGLHPRQHFGTDAHRCFNQKREIAAYGACVETLNSNRYCRFMRIDEIPFLSPFSTS